MVDVEQVVTALKEKNLISELATFDGSCFRAVRVREPPVMSGIELI